MVGSNTRQVIAASLALASALAVCCKHEQKNPTATSKQAVARPAPTPPAAGAKPASAPRGLPPFLRLPITPGAGMGPIRLGANVATLERLMRQPCEEKSDSVCRYITKGVEYELKDGVTQAIQLHRPSRRVTAPGLHSPEAYGVLNAVIPPDVAMGMLPEWVQKAIGEPKKIEKVADGGVNKTVERHLYDGLVLEYDLNAENGAQILGGIRIVKGGK